MNSVLTKVNILLLSTLYFLLVACNDKPHLPTEEKTQLNSAEENENIEYSNGPFAPLPDTYRTIDAKVSLGKLLFNDTRLSGGNSVSCASCHDLGSGGDDGKQKSTGIRGAIGLVNTPTVINASYNFSQFWDGRAATLEEQVAGPIHNPIEMATDWQTVIGKLSKDQNTVDLFDDIFDDGITSDNVVDAIVAYERSLISVNSKFDLYLRGETSTFSELEKQGLDTFLRLGCASCHQGRNLGGNMFQRFGIMGSYFEDRGVLTTSDLGRYNVTGREEDKFVFRVPSLRNVALTAPYFHDGTVETLENAVKIMAKYQLGRPISKGEVESIVSFLNTLTGEIDPELR